MDARLALLTPTAPTGAAESPPRRPHDPGAWGPSLAVLAPVVAAILVYLPALAGGFVYDDSMVISTNDFVQDLSNLPGLVQKDWYYGGREGQGGCKEQSYRPTGTLSHMLECALFQTGERPPAEPNGDRPPTPLLAGAFRLTNVLIHALNALLIFAFARRIGGLSALGAAVAGALFAIHPLATEAVAVASFREDLLTLFFLLVAALAFAAPPPRLPALWQHALVAVAALLAMLSKEVGAVAVVFCAASAWAVGRPPWRERPAALVAAYGPLVAVTAFYAWVRFSLFYNAGEGTTPLPGGNQWSNACTMVTVFPRYAGLLVWPQTLRGDYMIEIRHGLGDPAVLVGVAGTIAAVALAGAAALRSRAAALGVLLAALAFATVANIVPIRNICAERYCYVPIAGFAIVVGAAVAAGHAWLRRRFRGEDAHVLADGGIAVLLCVVAVTLVARTVRRLPELHHDDAFWTAALRDEPLSTRGHIAIAGAQLARVGPAAKAAGDAKAERKAQIATREHCVAINSIAFHAPRPGHEDDPKATWPEVFGDSQAERRRFESWRIMAELHVGEAEKCGSSGEHVAAALRWSEARREIERAIEVAELAGSLTPKDQGMWAVRGRIYEALPSFAWRRFWNHRDLAFGHAALGAKAEALTACRAAAQALDDAGYLASLTPDFREQIAPDRWRTWADLAAAATGDERKTAATRACAEARDRRTAGAWPVEDVTAWRALAAAARHARGEEAGPAAGDLPAVVRTALLESPPPDRRAALDEGRRLAGAGQYAAAHLLVDWALGPDAPGTVPDAEPDALWAAFVDRLWIRDVAGEMERPADREVAVAALARALEIGARPHFQTRAESGTQWTSHDGVVGRQRGLRATALARRARWLVVAPLYAEAAAAAGHPERDALRADAWRDEYDLGWYESWLGRHEASRLHYRACLEAFERAERDGWPAGQIQDAALFGFLRDAASAIGDTARRDRFEARRRAATGAPSPPAPALPATSQGLAGGLALLGLLAVAVLAEAVRFGHTRRGRPAAGERGRLQG